MRIVPTLAAILQDMGTQVITIHVLPDDEALISELLRRLADEEDVPLILTTGGTGPTARDHTPEATRAIIEREMPGLARTVTLGWIPPHPLGGAKPGRGGHPQTHLDHQPAREPQGRA